MHDLKTNHPETWRELETGNMPVTKNDIPFVSISADHTCEHLNKMVKIHSGLIGISNIANARHRFFVATPELSCMSTEFKSQFTAGTDTKQNTEHPDLGSNQIKRDHETIDKIKSAILSHGNPITTPGEKLNNMITNANVPLECVPKILSVDDTGQKLYEDYISERINGEVSLWAPVRKENNKMFMSGNKKATIIICDKTVDFKETKDLYGRRLVPVRSNRQIDQKHAISNYEFTLTQRALFAASGAMLPCTDKSKLIHLLENLARADTSEQDSPRAARGVLHGNDIH